MQFFRYVDGLRTMRGTLVASDAMTGLSQFRYTAVVAYKESASCFFVVFTCLALRNIPFVDTLVVMYENGRNIDAVWTGHAIFTVITGDGRILHHQLRGFFQILFVVIGQRNQW